MTKLLFAIFAHPDDEAFGPAGTLLKLRDEGYDIHLILLTDGDAGVNIDDVPNLATTRLLEWHVSAKILKASSTNALHYPDGTLETIHDSKLNKQVSRIISDTITTYSGPVEISFMTFEPNGLTGHRDHIVASHLTSQVAQQFETKTIWYYCLDSTQAPLEDTPYYHPQAREDTYITDRIDISTYLGTIFKMIDAHVSQREDGANRKALGNERLATECFHINRY